MSVTTGYLLFCAACVLYAVVRIKWFDGPPKPIREQTLIGARAKILRETKKEAESRRRLMHYRRRGDPTIWWGFVDPSNLPPEVTLMADQEACSREWAVRAIRESAPELYAKMNNGDRKETGHGA